MCNYWGRQVPRIAVAMSIRGCPREPGWSILQATHTNPVLCQSPNHLPAQNPQYDHCILHVNRALSLSLSTNPFVQVPSALLGRHPSPPFLWRLCWCSHAKQPIAPHSTGNISWFMWFMDIYGLLKYVDFQSSEISSLPWKTCLILTASSSLGWSHPPLMAGMQPAESPGLPLDHEAQWISISEV